MSFHCCGILGVMLVQLCITHVLADSEPIDYTPYNYTALVPIEPGMTRNRQLVQIFQNDPNLTAKIDVRKPIAFVVHGWTDSFFSGFLDANGESWPVATIGDWVRYTDTTACGVDWSKLSSDDYVHAALRNTHLVGFWLARLLVSLSKVGLPFHRVTISGHSLGAHVAGFAGKNVKAWTGGRRLATIFGLDPAGPLFTFPVPAQPPNILQPGDADFVQVLHTSANTLGVALDSHTGDAMFVANDGMLQPNCRLFESTAFGIEASIPFQCSHRRAVQYFRSSLNPRHRFVGRRCDDADDADGLCELRDLLRLFSKQSDDADDLLGIYTQRKRGVFELQTTGTPPFCIDC